MQSTSPYFLSDVSDAQIQAIIGIKKNTTFLWRAFVTKSSDKKNFTCPIRQTTFERVNQALILLSESGYFQFDLVYGASNQDQSIVEVEISAITDHFMEIIWGLFPEIKKPEPLDATVQGVVQEVTSVLAPSRSMRVSTTKPLMPPSPHRLMQMLQASSWTAWLTRKTSWLMVVGLLLLFETLHWVHWSTVSVASRAKGSKVVVSVDGQLVKPVERFKSASFKPSNDRLALEPAKRLYTPVVFPVRGLRFPPEYDTLAASRSELSQKSVVVDVRWLNMRATPSFQGLMLKSLAYGAMLRVQWQKSGWLQVMDEANHVGWVTAYATKDALTQQRVDLFDSFSLEASFYE